MLSVSSARQLCKMFFSLHVFLSVAMVESSASNGNKKGKMTHYGQLFLYLICCKNGLQCSMIYFFKYMHNNVSFFSSF